MLSQSPGRAGLPVMSPLSLSSRVFRTLPLKRSLPPAAALPADFIVLAESGKYLGQPGCPLALHSAANMKIYHIIAFIKTFTEDISNSPSPNYSDCKIVVFLEFTQTFSLEHVQETFAIF